MNKTLLGDWASALDDRGYAEAVAGLGVHAAPSSGMGNRLRWRSHLLDSGSVLDWRDVGGLDPAMAGSLWRPGILNVAVPSRILDWPSLDDPDALLDTLLFAGPRSLIIEPTSVDELAQRSWRWPLRVGVLPGADRKSLADFFAASTAPGLFYVEELDGSRESCDLLLLPRTTRDSMFGSHVFDDSIRARATVVMTELGHDNTLGRSARADADEVRSRYGASAIIGLPTRLTPDVVGAVFRELAHNRHLDEAVFDALVGLGIPRAPCILGTSNFMRDSCLLSIANRYDRIYRKGLLPLRPSVRAFRGRPTPNNPVPPGALASQLVRQNGFEHETDGASALAAEHTKVEALVDSRRVPRWIHAQFLDHPTLEAHAGSSAPPLVEDTKPPVGPHGTILIVRVSPSVKSRNSSDAVPEDGIDFSTGSVLLHVMVELSGATILPLASTPRTWREVFDSSFIKQLPRGGAQLQSDRDLVAIAQCPITLAEVGESSLATFYLVPHETTREIIGRISLIYRNRILQTVRLTAQGTWSMREPDRDLPAEGLSGGELVGGFRAGAIDFAADPHIRDRLDDLGDVRDFDATLLVADDLRAAPHMTIRRGERIEQLSLSDAAVREPTERIVAALDKLTRRPPDQDVLHLDAERVKLSLFTLASYGRLLYQALPEWVQLPDCKRIQVVTRGSSYFPAEFAYDGPAPAVTASICENSVAALGSGSCGECPHQQSDLHVCPLRFFGLSRTIERHSSPTGATAATTKRGPRPSPTRTPFGDPAPVLRGASTRAYAFASSVELVDELRASLSALDSAAVEASSWRQWSAAAARKPKLFVALPHSDEYQGVPVLELGQGDLISQAQIATAGLFAGGDEPRLVMLLGCSIAEPTKAFTTYPSEFRAAGADIVIATLAPILGADSVPIASEFARILNEVRQTRRQALGELLALVRRRCLAAGHPGVLGIVAYGDADWVFGGE